MARAPACGRRRPGVRNKQFTVFVDNVVGNPPRPARLRRIHAVVSGLLKISSSEDFAGLAVRQNPDAKKISMQTAAMSNLSGMPDRLLVPSNYFEPSVMRNRGTIFSTRVLVVTRPIKLKRL